jgi:hypothetical protein
VSAPARRIERVADDESARREWPFDETEFGDHFETPKRAYSDVKPVLRAACRALGTTPELVRLYDPYYCRGRTSRLLGQLGFANVLHQKRDFYADIAAGRVPPHDVLLTNPPYSHQHKERLYRYILEAQRAAVLSLAGKGAQKGAPVPVPFLVLLPAWSAAKLGWRQLLWCLARLRAGHHSVTFEQAASGERGVRVGAFSERLEEQAGCFYIVPARKYKFVAAVEARDEAPFDGIWFCGGLPSADGAGGGGGGGGGGSGGGSGGGGGGSSGSGSGSSGGGGVQALRAAYDKKRAKSQAKRAKGAATDTAVAAVAAVASSSSSPTLIGSLAELRAAGLLPPEELSEEEQMRRKRALAALDEERRAAPLHALRKKQKLLEAREASKVSFGRDLSPAERARVVEERACQHFFLGLGCTRGAKCRFAHALEGI